MKLNVLGVKRIEGNAKATGNPFDMCRLFAAVPIEIATGKVNVSGFGFELAEISLDPAALDQFRGVKFPAVLDCTSDSRPFRGKLETVITGFLAAAVKAA
jgi:hypothetical protein